LAAPRDEIAAPAGLYGPQPNFDVTSPKADDAVPAPLDAMARPVDGVDGLAGETRYPAEAPSRAAATAAQTLVTAGLSASLADDVVAEAAAHGLPFAQPRAFKGLVRAALARRMPVLADLGGGPRPLAFL